MKIAILDDYQQVALKMADWSRIPAEIPLTAFKEHFATLEELKARLINCGILVAMRERTNFPGALLEQLPALRLLVTTGMRNASIDMKAASRLGILVCGTRGGGPTTAELAWGLIIGIMRHIPQESNAVRQGRWQTTLGSDLNGKVLGLMGLGNLGSRMASVGKAFGMTVIAWSQNLTSERAAQCGADLVSKDELLARSDILSIHLQLSERTRGLVGARELSLMKPTSYLINTSRGPIVVEEALIAALQNRRIAGAGLDVFDTEPLPADHLYRKLDNILVTPHLGYVTSDTYKTFYSEAVDDIAAYLKGEPLRVLNPDALGKNRALTG